MTGKRDIVTQLIAAGADINARDNVGRTPLHYAIRRSDATLQRLLIAKGADTNISSMKAGKPVKFELEADIASLGLALNYVVDDMDGRGAKTLDLEFTLSGTVPVLYPAPEEQTYLHIEGLIH